MSVQTLKGCKLSDVSVFAVYGDWANLKAVIRLYSRAVLKFSQGDFKRKLTFHLPLSAVPLGMLIRAN